MTKDEFMGFYPQFGAVPNMVVDEYIMSANGQFDDFLDSAAEARRLYVAHKLTLYCQSSAPESASVSKLANAGSMLRATSKNVGGVSVGLSEGSAASGINGWNEWKLTSFGLQLITLAKRALGCGVYVP